LITYKHYNEYTH